MALITEANKSIRGLVYLRTGQVMFLSKHSHFGCLLIISVLCVLAIYSYYAIFSCVRTFYNVKSQD